MHPHYLQSLHINSSLRDLPLAVYQVEPGAPCKKIRDVFQHNPTLPGVLVVEGNNVLALISRRRLLERLSQPYALDVFLKRPIYELPEFQNARNFLALEGDLPIAEGLNAALARISETAYEPLVVVTEVPQILDVSVLLIAHAHVFKLTSALLRQEQQAAEVRSAQIAELQRLNLLKDDFLSTVSHELRTPMTNIKMAIYMLKGAADLERANVYLEVLDKECTREINLINDLLDLQQLDAGERLLKTEDIVLQHWLPDILAPFQNRALQRDLLLSIEILPIIPKIVSDTNSLKRVIVELVNNACKYTPPKGQIRLQVSLKAQRIQLTIMNSGPPIPMEEQERIFQKFYRIPNNDPWSQGGTGLGLALVKKIVEQLQGQIHVASRLDHSALKGWNSFLVELPLVLRPPLTPVLIALPVIHDAQDIMLKPLV